MSGRRDGKSKRGARRSNGRSKPAKPTRRAKRAEIMSDWQTLSQKARPTEIDDEVMKHVSMDQYDHYVAGLAELTTRERETIKAHRRRIVNRMHAAQSRARARSLVENVTSDVSKLHAENNRLNANLQQCQVELDEMRSQLYYARERLSELQSYCPFELFPHV